MTANTTSTGSRADWARWAQEISALVDGCRTTGDALERVDDAAGVRELVDAANNAREALEAGHKAALGRLRATESVQRSTESVDPRQKSREDRDGQDPQTLKSLSEAPPGGFQCPVGFHTRLGAPCSCRPPIEPAAAAELPAPPNPFRGLLANQEQPPAHPAPVDWRELLDDQPRDPEFWASDQVVRDLVGPVRSFAESEPRRTVREALTSRVDAQVAARVEDLRQRAARAHASSMNRMPDPWELRMFLAVFGWVRDIRSAVTVRQAELATHRWAQVAPQLLTFQPGLIETEAAAAAGFFRQWRLDGHEDELLTSWLGVDV